MLICGEKFEDKYGNDEKYCKVRNHWHYTNQFKGAAHSICTLRYSILKQIIAFFRSWPNYDYNFIIKDVAEELERQFTCLRENTEKCIKFSVSIEKNLKKLLKLEKKLQKSYLAN